MCFYSDADEPRCSRREVRKARKPHKCQECGTMIERGQLYYSFSGIDAEGDGFADAYCGACEANRYAIHELEIAKGCSWSESWCPNGELHYAMQELDDDQLTPATVEAGQAFLARQKNYE